MALSSPLIRCAINGYGRIGKAIFRALYEYRIWPIKIVAINDLVDPHMIAHLTKFDSTHGRFHLPVELDRNILRIENDRIRLIRQEDPTRLLWDELGIDVVFECTGRYKTREQAELHLRSGATKVIISNPADKNVDATIVYGVNHNQLSGREKIISNASCTSNCIIPVIIILEQAFGIICGNITTIHSAMNDQPVIDSNKGNQNFCRAAGTSMIPVDTQLNKGIQRILPEFTGCFETTSIRVPTQNVTAIDLTVLLKMEVSIIDINNALNEASKIQFNEIMDYCEIPLASIDFNHDPHSCIVDGTQTRVSGKKLAKLLVWCDNEWGFANRMLDTTVAAMMNIKQKRPQHPRNKESVYLDKSFSMPV